MIILWKNRVLEYKYEWNEEFVIWREKFMIFVLIDVSKILHWSFPGFRWGLLKRLESKLNWIFNSTSYFLAKNRWYSWAMCRDNRVIMERFREFFSKYLKIRRLIDLNHPDSEYNTISFNLLWVGCDIWNLRMKWKIIRLEKTWKLFKFVFF